MKRILLASLGALALISLNGCYADVAPYSYGPAYSAPPVVYSAPTYAAPAYAAPAYVAPAYAAPAYRPAARVYVAPPRPYYRTAAVPAPRYRHGWY